MEPTSLGQDGMVQFLASETSAGFDVALIVHVVSGAISVVVLAAAYASAMALGRRKAGEPWLESDRRFFRPGREVGGRSVYLVPVTGFVVLVLSGSEFSMADGFISIGMLLSLVVIALGELLVFPAIGRLRRLVSSSDAAPSSEEWRAELAKARWGIDGIILALVIGAIVMVAKP